MRFTRNWILALTAAGLLILFVTGSWWWQNTDFYVRDGYHFPMYLHPAEDPDAVPVISATDLLIEYDKDSKATMRKNERRVWLKGTVTEISGPLVMLESRIRCTYVSVNDTDTMAVGKEIMIEGLLRNAGSAPDLFRPWKRRP